MIPPAGPPITLPLGWLLPGGQVWGEIIGAFVPVFFAHVPGATRRGVGG